MLMVREDFTYPVLDRSSPFRLEDMISVLSSDSD